MIVKVFGASNCSGCVTVKRLLNERGIDYNEYDVNNGEHMEAAIHYRVRSIPTVVFNDDSGVHTYVGATNCIDGIKQHLEV